MPFPDNTPGIDELINLPASEIALLPVDLLAAMQREIDTAAKQMKAVTARFNTALEVRFATRAAEQDLVHLVQARIGPDQFAYIAIARRKPRQAGASLSVRLLEAA